MPPKSSTAVAVMPSSAVIDQVLVKGDLSSLTAPQRVEYYTKLCESLGLNPLTKPFEYITLNNKLVLYALRACTEQLRTIRGVSVEELTETEREGVFIVTAKVKDKDGRTDISKGAVSVTGLKGEALANALMKAETKAKRRATLSICGLGFLDETEVETIPGAKIGEPAPVVAAAIEVKPQPETVSGANSNAPIEANKAAVHGISGEGLEPTVDTDPPAGKAAPKDEGPVDMNIARSVFSSVWKMVDDAKDNRDIDDSLKANAEGLRMLERASLVNYNKLKAHATSRRQQLKVDTFEEDFGIPA